MGFGIVLDAMTATPSPPQPEQELRLARLIFALARMAHPQTRQEKGRKELCAKPMGFGIVLDAITATPSTPQLEQELRLARSILAHARMAHPQSRQEKRRKELCAKPMAFRIVLDALTATPSTPQP